MKLIFLLSVSVATLCFHHALLFVQYSTKPLSNVLSTQFRKSNYLLNGRALHIKKWRATTDDQSSTWLIDEDTSEIECESSAELARKIVAEKARIEAEIALKKKLEEEERLRLAMEEEKKKKELELAVVVPVTESTAAVAPTGVVVVESSNSDKAPTPPKKTSAFDVGLLILFPVMIGSLLLFLFFPVIGQQLAASLPPPS
jgi:hypothetical protein